MTGLKTWLQDDCMKIAIISGTGFYNLLDKTKKIQIETPFGVHSEMYKGILSGKEIVFLNRHGDGHRFAPHEIPHEANIFALKKAGIDCILSTSSTGIINNNIITLGDLIIPDDLYDDTARIRTLYKQPVVVHVNMSEPFCPELRKTLIESAGTAHTKSVYVCSRGPQLETPAQIRAYQQMKFDIVGMSIAAEAKLAREAEICYATISTCDNYATGVSKEKPDAKAITSSANKNSERLKKIIKIAVTKIYENRKCGCRNALDNAVISEKKPDLF